MSIYDLLLKTMDEVIGLPEDELRSSPDLDLFNEGLLDSLSCVTLINSMEQKLGIHIDIKKMKPDDFVTAQSIADAISAQC